MDKVDIDGAEETIGRKFAPDNSGNVLLDLDGDAKADVLIKPKDIDGDGVLDQAKVVQVFVGDSPIDVSSEPGIEILANQIGVDYIKVGEGIRYIGGGRTGAIEVQGRFIQIDADQVAKVDIASSDDGTGGHTQGMLFLKQTDDEGIKAVFVFDQDGDRVPESFIVEGVAKDKSVQSAIDILKNQVVRKNQFDPKIGFQGKGMKGIPMLKNHLSEAGIIVEPDPATSSVAVGGDQASGRDRTDSTIGDRLKGLSQDQLRELSNEASLKAFEQDLPNNNTDIDQFSFDNPKIKVFLRGLLVKSQQDGDKGEKFLADVLKTAFPDDQTIQRNPMSAALVFKDKAIPLYLNQYDQLGPQNKQDIVNLLKSAQEVLRQGATANK